MPASKPAPRMQRFKVGERVKVIAAPGKLQSRLEQHGDVIEVPCEVPVYLVTVQFDDGVKVTIPGNYLTRVQKPQTRRGAFHMYSPGDTRSEDERKLAGITRLKMLGYEVLDTDSHRGKAICGRCTTKARKIPGNQRGVVYGQCPQCSGAVFSPTTGADSGVSDTIIWREGYPIGGGFLLEWKDGENGDRRPEQARLEKLGMIVVAWDEESMARAVLAYERSIGLAPKPTLVKMANLPSSFS